MSAKKPDDANIDASWLKSGSTDSAGVAAYYDEWAKTYNTTLSEWDYQAPADAAAALAPHLKSGAIILDVGCGTGLFATAMHGVLECQIEGIDISQASLDLATKSGSYQRTQQLDLQALPLPIADNTFDAAACVGVFTYIEVPAQLLADLCRVVKPGGRILFTQRDDRWSEHGFDALIKDFESRGLWLPLMISEPKLYLPGNEDYTDVIRVIHVLCQVGETPRKP